MIPNDDPFRSLRDAFKSINKFTQPMISESLQAQIGAVRQLTKSFGSPVTAAERFSRITPLAEEMSRTQKRLAESASASLHRTMMGAHEGFLRDIVSTAAMAKKAVAYT